jgi:iron complex transport system substrate-binding protein
MHSPRFRSWAPPALFVVLIAMIATAVERYASPPGGLQLPVAATGEGSAAIRTGSLAYPREAIDSDNQRVTIPRRPRRIVSQYWSIDEYVYSVAPPDSVVAVSESAYHRSYSNVFSLAERFRPAIASDPERVLSLAPDLVLVSSEGRADYTSLVRGSGVPVYRMQITFHTLEQVEKTILLTGYLTGNDEAARKEAARFHACVENARGRAALARARGLPRPRVLGIGGRHGYGSNTFFHDVLQAVGAVDVAAENGLEGFTPLDFEQVAVWNPDWILSSANQGQSAAVLAQLAADPAISTTNAARNHRILVFESSVMMPMSPFSTRFITALADALYGRP